MSTSDSTGHAPQPPRVARWLLARILAPVVRDAMLGDLDETFARDIAAHAPDERWTRCANRRYWREVVHAPRSWLLPRAPARRATIHTSPGDPSVSLLLSDIRFALRTMSRRMGSTIVITGTLALGIGASTAIFSAVYPILVRTLPYPKPERLTRIWEREKDLTNSNLGFATFDDLERNNRSFESMTAMSWWTMGL